jgi:AcrR family transcriptional regulator
LRRPALIISFHRRFHFPLVSVYSTTGKRGNAVASSVRLSKEQRRAKIVHAVRRIFAEKGFDGTTTRELADAAEISEALLFKHFPTKQALYAAMQHACCTEQDRGRFKRLTNLEESASTLVLMVHFLVSLMLRRRVAGNDDQLIHNRLILRSLCGDGEFARLMLEPLAGEWIDKIERCHRSAVRAGEASADVVGLELRGWFVHHLPAAVAFFSLPNKATIDYGVPTKRLVEQIVWFCLRGIGLKDRVIRRHYNPGALALFDE